MHFYAKEITRQCLNEQVVTVLYFFTLQKRAEEMERIILCVVFCTLLAESAILSRPRVMLDSEVLEFEVRIIVGAAFSIFGTVN